MANVKWGLIDRSGKQIIPCRYDFLWWPSATGIFPAMIDGKWHYFRLDESYAFEGEFEDASTCVDGRCVVRLNSKEGLIDENGTRISPFEFDAVEEFNEGRAVVRKGEYYGFVDRDGIAKTPVHFSDAFSFSESRGLVRRKSEYWGYVDWNGEIVIPFQFDEADSFGEGLAYVTKKASNGKIIEKGYVDLDGEYVIRATEWGSGGRFSEGLATADFSRGGELRMGYLNRQGEVVIEPRFEFGSYFREGRAYIRRKNRYGAIDSSGKVVIKPLFLGAFMFHEGLAVVRLSPTDRFSFIGRDGEQVIPERFDHASSFKNGYARVAMEV